MESNGGISQLSADLYTDSIGASRMILFYFESLLALGRGGDLVVGMEAVGRARVGDAEVAEELVKAMMRIAVRSAVRRIVDGEHLDRICAVVSRAPMFQRSVGSDTLAAYLDVLRAARGEMEADP
ncbi:MAG: hypothetical protein AB1725_09215 [Armatimonadota bacterium]